ncbi:MULTISPECIES: C40 family peptidase [Streptomycetaceae]|uniref:NLP/P60 family secreted protein n=1 Tax=Streptantibioticus cattleyicolor (strain ATCC 35852 / DSM 46488 / JCM 4925 / NBRC 14057 / NRRL 8057) TaxID=1003195 RepID=F8JPE6_STREN
MVRRPRGWGRAALVCAGLAGSAVLAAPATSAFAAPSPPDQPGTTAPALPGTPATLVSPDYLTSLLTRLQTLYLQAEQATERYDATKEKLDKQQARTDAVNKQLTDERAALSAGQDLAGAIARQQYQGGSVSPYMRLLLSEDPAEAMAVAHVLQEAAGNQASLVKQLRAGEKRLTELSAQAQTSLDQVRNLADQQRKDRDDVKAKLSAVEKAVASLTGAQLAELSALEQHGIDQAQKELLASGKLGSVSRTPSAPGEQAIAYAFAQLGKPYVWGATGPDSFDCSGLTSQAWAHAGRAIPRTSQEQWADLPKVPLDLLRPGDLIVYFPGATHVALYIGDGLVVQAPRPGGVVKVSPIAANPVLGAVRPDATSPSVDTYRLPGIPADARRPTPLGAPADAAKGR